MLTIWRKGAEERVSVTVEAAPPPASGANRTASQPTDDPLLGLQVRALTPELREEYGYRGGASVIVTGIARGSLAEQVGLRPGLGVLQADMKPITRPRDLLDTFADHVVMLLAAAREANASYILLKADR